jgi:hypothetical protein
VRPCWLFKESVNKQPAARVPPGRCAGERDVEGGVGENMVRADGLNDAVQNAEAMLRRGVAVVIAELHVERVGIGAEDGDGADGWS